MYRGVPSCPCYRRVSRLGRPDLCCSCVGVTGPSLQHPSAAVACGLRPTASAPAALADPAEGASSTRLTNSDERKGRQLARSYRSTLRGSELRWWRGRAVADHPVLGVCGGPAAGLPSCVVGTPSGAAPGRGSTHLAAWPDSGADGPAPRLCHLARRRADAGQVRQPVQAGTAASRCPIARAGGPGAGRSTARQADGR